MLLVQLKLQGVRIMNKKMVLDIALIVLVMMLVFACTQKSDLESDFKVLLIDGGKGVRIIEYVGTKFEVSIPSKIQKLPVIQIGDEAFQEKNLIKISIPSNVTHIGTSAFAGNELTNVIIPNSVIYIGNYAFGWNKLTSISIPNSVTYLSGFSGNQLTSVIIPNSVTEIGYQAFDHNQLTSVIIPDSVTKIGGHAFNQNKLTTITIPESVTEIEDFAFVDTSDNLSLTSITIGANVKLASSMYSNPPFGYAFNLAYLYTGMQAGTYTRPNASSDTWTNPAYVYVPAEITDYYGTWNGGNTILFFSATDHIHKTPNNSASFTMSHLTLAPMTFMEINSMGIFFSDDNSYDAYKIDGVITAKTGNAWFNNDLTVGSSYSRQFRLSADKQKLLVAPGGWSFVRQ